MPLARLSRDVDQSSRMLVLLNLETSDRHAAADEGWLSLVNDEVTRLDYSRQLAKTYGFEAPLEAAFAYTPELKLHVDLRRRSRAGLAAQDLLALGLHPAEVAEVPQCPSIEPFTSPLEALGWLYVSERTTLVHDAIRQHLLERMPDLENACAYLSARHGCVGSRWSELGHTLDRVVRSPTMMDLVIASAHAAFLCLAEWCRTDPVDHALGGNDGAAPPALPRRGAVRDGSPS